MGGHYGSVQVRSEDHDRIRAAAEQVASEMKIRVLVGPVLNGWIGLYPQNNGQDDAVARAIAQRVEGHVLHLLVHDDDIFAYWLYFNGLLIDSYWSAPGYFGEKHRAAEEKMIGNPEAFRPLIAEKVRDLPSLLDRDKGKRVMEYERLAEFAKVLGISNAVQAYEYLMGGERTGVKGWRQFVELPVDAVAREKQRKKDAKNLIRDERKRLNADGILLLCDERKEGIPYGCALSNGFVVAWPDHTKRTVSFAEYHQPWDKPQPLVLESPAHITAVASDASGQRVAMSAGDRVRIWDVLSNRWHMVSDILESDLAIGVAISGDGKRVAHTSREEIVVTEVESSRRLAALPEERRAFSFHPNEEWLAIGGKTLGLIGLGEKPHLQEHLIGGKSAPAAAVNAANLSKLREVDLETFDKDQSALMDRVTLKLEKMAEASHRPQFSQEQIEWMRNELKSHIAATRARIVAVKEGRVRPQVRRGREQIGCVGFSRDGRWLWCGTNLGVRVYDWANTPRDASSEMPPPVWTFDLPAPSDWHASTWVWGIEEEVDARAVVFGGGTGRLYRMDLANGKVRELINIPGDTRIINMTMSIDGNTLGIATRTPPSRLRGQGGDDRTCWWVWSYSKLRG